MTSGSGGASRSARRTIAAQGLSRSKSGCSLSVAGALSAHYFRFLSPEATEPLLITFLTWVMLMAGGSGNNKGAIIGALAVWGIWSMTEILTNRLPAELATRSSYIRMLLIGLLLQFVLQRYRSGLFPERSPGIAFDKDNDKPHG